MSDEHGAHAYSARAGEAALTFRLQDSRQTDALLTAAVHGVVERVGGARRRLDGIGAELRAAMSAPRTPALDTPVGARQFQRFLAAKARDIGRVLAETLADSRRQAGLLRASGDGYSIPARVRDRANRQAMAEDIRRVEQATEAISSTDMTRYDNALRVREGLAADSGDGANEVLLLSYEPDAFGGRGRAVIAIGDPDAADNTTVLVPGVHNSVRGGYLSHPDALNLYREAVRADPDRSNAIIVWMGYRAPDSLLDPAVAQPVSAREGGRALAADVNTLRATHTGPSHVTVIGHSYGSTTVADAAAGFGLRADDVVLVGCPGTDLAHSAKDFHLPAGGHVYVGAASWDPIVGFGGQPQLSVPGTATTLGLGDDPAARGYGSTRFKAEVPGLAVPMTGHGSYFSPGGESLFSIGDIASGHGNDLAAHRMTAPHRHRLPAFDAERLRPGSGNHRH